MIVSMRLTIELGIYTAGLRVGQTRTRTHTRITTLQWEAEAHNGIDSLQLAGATVVAGGTLATSEPPHPPHPTPTYSSG